MDLKSMSVRELVDLQEGLQELHTGAANKSFAIVEVNPSGQLNPHKQTTIADDRLNDLLWVMLIETYNELCDRFKNKINMSPEPQPIPPPPSPPQTETPFMKG